MWFGGSGVCALETTKRPMDVIGRSVLMAGDFARCRFRQQHGGAVLTGGAGVARGDAERGDRHGGQRPIWTRKASLLHAFSPSSLGHFHLRNDEPK